MARKLDDDTWPLVRRLFAENAMQQWRLYAVAFVLMAIAAGCTAASAYLLGDVVNKAYVEKSFPGIVAIGIVTFATFLVKGAATYGQAVILSRIGYRIIADNQRRMFDRMLNQGLAFFSERHSADFIARLTAGANAASYVIGMMVTAVGRDLLSLIALIGVMVWQDPVMSLFGFGVVPPAMIVLRKLVRRIRAVARTQFTGGALILESMQEAVQGIRIVKAFTLENAMRERFDRNVGAVEKESFKMARVANRSSPLMETLGGFAIAAATVYGGYRVVVTGAAPGEFFSFIAAFIMAYEPAKRLARLNLDLNTNLVGVRVLYEIVDTPLSEPVEDDHPPLILDKSRIAFDRVSFAYKDDAPVLRGMSFTAEPGKVTALVGPSGGGKSTVLNLLMRFYDASSGLVTIDGQDVTAVSRKSLRAQIGYVGQHVQLFTGTIRENIALGRVGASEDEIVAAATAASAHDFIARFPQGYETPVGEHGLALSGGQRQRIAIARALIRNAPIILLDEATAALDAESERHVQEALALLCKGRTTLVIAHRLSTIMHADAILVIEHGVVTEQGRHDELLRRGGRYASFYRLQLQEAVLPEIAASELHSAERPTIEELQAKLAQREPSNLSVDSVTLLREARDRD